jgi:hypothetical protein
MYGGLLRCCGKTWAIRELLDYSLREAAAAGVGKTTMPRQAGVSVCRQAESSVLRAAKGEGWAVGIEGGVARPGNFRFSIYDLKGARVPSI